MNQPKLGSRFYQLLINIRIAALLTGAAILFFACENDLEKIKAFSTPENLPVAEAKNFETQFTDSGKVVFYLKAPELLRFENEGKTYAEFPSGIELVKYNSNRQIVSSITADYAKQFVKEQKWEAKNNVVATNVKGDTLKTEHLIWEEKEEKIYTEEFVRIIRKDQIITGIGFTSDQSLQNWKIKNPKGTIYLEVESNTISNDSTQTNSAQSDSNDLDTNKPLEFEQ